jgi:hypothetical protein
MRRTLELHSDFAPGVVRRLEVTIERPTPQRLSLRYALAGDMERLQLPAPAEPLRADELWRSTCFEAFLRQDDGPGYLEFNFAPSHEWAAYGFAGYREGMRVAGEIPAPRLASERTEEGYELTAILDLGPAANTPWRLAVSAVIEDVGGGKTYWALAHPPGKPDFHHPESFVLDLPLLEAP